MCGRDGNVVFGQASVTRMDEGTDRRGSKHPRVPVFRVFRLDATSSLVDQQQGVRLRRCPVDRNLRGNRTGVPDLHRQRTAHYT